ncbi:MAG: hypothetical protein CBC38_00190 [Gammaproteobacteria bacterium TMED78]|nr:MAG: hypothetical protein CBC38_00190 [Gammaproteobacteria bacterium TMED78]
MNSCIFEGYIRHRRTSPVVHNFKYKLFMFYLDLSELNYIFKDKWFWSINKPNFASFNRGRHMGSPSDSLDISVRKYIKQETSKEFKGRIYLLTQMSYLGYGFNPVSFYYCFSDLDSKNLEFIITEVNNTPWGDQYCYLLNNSKSIKNNNVSSFKLKKDFHVSPFMSMDLDYDWKFNSPFKSILVHMENFKKKDKFFDATLSLNKKTNITSLSLFRLLVFYPLITFKIIIGIYWEAFFLWLKGCVYHDYPEKNNDISMIDEPPMKDINNDN